MEFSAQKTDLLKELNLTQGVVEKKTTIPILSNLLMEFEGSGVRISATDLELGVRCTCPAKVKKEGAGTVPAKRLLEIVRSLPDSEIRFRILEPLGASHLRKVFIQTGGNGEGQFPGAAGGPQTFGYDSSQRSYRIDPEDNLCHLQRGIALYTEWGTLVA